MLLFLQKYGCCCCGHFHWCCCCCCCRCSFSQRHAVCFNRSGSLTPFLVVVAREARTHVCVRLAAAFFCILTQNSRFTARGLPMCGLHNAMIHEAVGVAHGFIRFIRVVPAAKKIGRSLMLACPAPERCKKKSRDFLL